MSKKPASVEIRTYQVGFGDCFLLSFVYSEKDKRHVLIDFGTTELPSRGRPKRPAKASEYMPKVAEDIKQVCGSAGRLTAVVATHRHADHISGFGTDARTGDSGSIIKALRPRLVLQPWTEDPKARRNATHASQYSARSEKTFISGLAAMHKVALLIMNAAMKNPEGVSPALRKQLTFLGMDNISNQSAVRNLIAMGRAKGSSGRWLRYGSSSGLERLLPGVKIRVLGPPDLKQSEKIRTMRKRDPDQFWHLLAGGSTLDYHSLRDAAKRNLFRDGLRRSNRRKHSVPVEARWFRDRLKTLRGTQLLEIVRSLDDQMNNTSLILLFEVFGKKLLFPGDAQIENWSYALQDAPDAEQVRKLLAQVDVYKVGHHGSLNATPRKLLWENFKKRKKARLDTLLSTLPGKHGSIRNETEVPRKTLLKALNDESRLQSTTELPFGRNPLSLLLEVRP